MNKSGSAKYMFIGCTIIFAVVTVRSIYRVIVEASSIFLNMCKIFGR